MAMLAKRRLSRRNLMFLFAVAALCVLYSYYSCSYMSLPAELPRDPEPEQDPGEIRKDIENRLEEALLLDKGMGCEIPELNPFSEDAVRFDKQLPDIVCHGQDWVRCYHSKCRLVDVIKSTMTDITCEYRDILYHSDDNYTIGPATTVAGDRVYELRASDHVQVSCTGRKRSDAWFSLTIISRLMKVKWTGNALGLRAVPPRPPPPGREGSLNVVIFGFDSTSRNGFRRRMPKSCQALKDIGMTVMEGYTIVGDGTPAALLPILTGKTELELPDVRKSVNNNRTCDSLPLIFHRLKQDGYRTAFFEDSPNIGTFQYRYVGFRAQPADHYLRAFSLEEAARKNFARYCVGDTPQFKLMMNITEQFLDLGGKRFIFTFIVDISHDDFNVIQSADDDTAAFLRGLLRRADDTLLVVMGDHGPRYALVRDTFQGKLEERLPLLAIKLPTRLTRLRPHAQRALAVNARALTTPHDLHATILDVLDMREHWNPYKVRGADLKRGLTMLEPIPRNRSCSEAGIEPHWCVCLAWQNVSTDDPLYNKTAQALLAYINSLLDPVGSLCVPRTLTSTAWVQRRRPSSKLLTFHEVRHRVVHFGPESPASSENCQAKIVVGPGRGVYEASMTYLVKEDRFLINTRDISRTNAYRSEPDCISRTHPHLNQFCYCRSHNANAFV